MITDNGQQTAKKEVQDASLPPPPPAVNPHVATSSGGYTAAASLSNGYAAAASGTAFAPTGQPYNAAASGTAFAPTGQPYNAAASSASTFDPNNKGYVPQGQPYNSSPNAPPAYNPSSNAQPPGYNPSSNAPPAYNPFSTQGGEQAADIYVEYSSQQNLLPEHDLYQMYRQQGFTEDLPVAQPIAEGWTPSQVAQLQNLQTANVVSEAQQGPSPQIDYTPSGALPVMFNPDMKRFKIRRDALHHGIKHDCSDVHSVNDLIEFFNAFNTAPAMRVDVKGYHTETYSDGKNTHSRTVTDFKYSVDVSSFIFPVGKITCDAKNQTETEFLQAFLDDKSRFKSIQMKKMVACDTEQLRKLVKHYIRYLGWRRGLTVRVKISNDSVRVTSDSRLARTWDSRFGRGMLILSMIGAAAVLVSAKGHRNRQALQSTFNTKLTAAQIFEAIRPRLWCRNQRTCNVM